MKYFKFLPTKKKTKKVTPNNIERAKQSRQKINWNRLSMYLPINNFIELSMQKTVNKNECQQNLNIA